MNEFTIKSHFDYISRPLQYLNYVTVTVKVLKKPSEIMLEDGGQVITSLILKRLCYEALTRGKVRDFAFIIYH